MPPKLVTEEDVKKQQILIIDKKATILGQLFKEKLNQYDAEVSISTLLQEDTKNFDYVFLINEELSKDFVKNNQTKKIIYLFIGQRKSSYTVAKWIYDDRVKNVKAINIPADKPSEIQLDKILWFALSRSRETYLNLEFIEKKPDKKPFLDFSKITRKKLLTFVAIFIILFYLSVFPLIAISSFLLYRSAAEFKKEKITMSKNYLSVGRFFDYIAEGLYSFTRPGYLFLSLALTPDNFITMNKKAEGAIDKSINIYENSTTVAHLMLKKNKSVFERNTLLVKLKAVQDSISQINDDLVVLNQKIPDLNQTSKIRSELTSSIELVHKLEKVLPLFDEILAKGTERKYLLLFANNMELRPGGGFIGSYGVLTMKDLTLENIDVYDVYDADGQLTFHVDPPAPIRKYLEQPNWFLRDSAFSPDFSQNYAQAKFFLEREMNLSGFSGGAIVTTGAIQNVLEAFGNIHLPNYDEIVNKDNFYLKAQLHSEQNFFPGSIQKKSFLGSLARQIFINLDTASFSKLIQGFKTSLDEKQISLAFEDNAIQDVIDSLYWSGRVILPKCPNKTPCLNDYLLPLDANLGVNKANFYISRTITQQVRIDKDGQVNNFLTINLKNNSPSDVFPGGKYKDYFQLELPKDTVVKNITKNGVLVEDIDEKQDLLKTVGFLIEISPHESAEIKIRYQLPDQLKKGRQIYQMIFQKQIGSKNSDLSLEVVLPDNLHLINQNFQPLVNGSHILYNTNLNADKLFIFELVRD